MRKNRFVLFWLFLVIPVRILALSVEFKDEQMFNPSMLALRTRIVNDSNIPVYNVKLRYIFTKNMDKELVLDSGYTAGMYVTLQMVDDTLGYVEIQVDSVIPGYFPNSSGFYQGLHYFDWSSVEKQSHLSYMSSSDFVVNSKILLYIGDSLVSGNATLLPPPKPKLKIIGFQSEGAAWIDVKNFGNEGISLNGVVLMGKDSVERILNPMYLDSMEIVRICRNDFACGKIEKKIIMPDFPWNRVGEALLKKDSTYFSYIPWGGIGNFAKEAVAANVWENVDDYFAPSMLVDYYPIEYTSNEFYRIIGNERGMKTEDWFSFTDRDDPSVIQTAPIPIKLTMNKPVNYRLTENDSVTLKWMPVKRTKIYRIVLRYIEKMITQVITTSETSIKVPLEDGEYSWLVYCGEYIDEEGNLRPIDENNNGIDVANTFLISENVNVNVWNALQIEKIAGYKDTRFLFLGYGQKSLDYKWDIPHTDEPNLSNSYRCWLIAAQLMNHIYGGDITQDEILYAVRFNNQEPLVAPFFPVGADSTEDIKALKFSLGTENVVRYKGAPSYDEVKREIDDGKPIYVGTIYPGEKRVMDEKGYLLRYDTTWYSHAMVIYGYVGNEDNYAFLYAFDDNYGNLTNSIAKPDSIKEYFLVRTSYDSLAMHDSRLDIDSDGDGITDFDEMERFGTDPYNSDTDEDGIEDKKEIFDYTIKSKYNTSTLFSFPDIARAVQEQIVIKSDVDKDGVRAELDMDDNNNGIKDGLEGLPSRYIESNYIPILDMNVPQDYTLFARDHLVINDGVECYNSIYLDGEYCRIGAAGQNTFSYDALKTVLSLGARSHIGSADVRPIDYNGGNVFVRSSSRIHNDLNLYIETDRFLCAQESFSVPYNEYLMHQGLIMIDGNVNTLCAYQGEKEKWWHGNYQCNLPDLDGILFEGNKNVRSGEIFYLRDGSAYKSLKVESGGTLIISPGEMFVDTLLQLESGAKIEFLNPGELSVLHLNGKIIWRPNSDYPLENVVYWSNVAKGFKIVQHSSNFMFIEGAFGGTIYAPLSKLILGQVHKRLYGRFLAKDLIVHQYTQIFRVDNAPNISPLYVFRR